MIPEIQHDPRGLNRIGIIQLADFSIATARDMAEAAEADPDRGFTDFAGPDCDCGDPSVCGARLYRSALRDARHAYRRAGLGMLADRVEVLSAQPLTRGAITRAWDQFDDANRNTEL